MPPLLAHCLDANPAHRQVPLDSSHSGPGQPVPPRHRVIELLTGVMIAAYTVVDGLGVQEAPLAAYIGWMFLLQGPPIAVPAAVRRRGRLGPALRASAGAGITGGAISLAASSIVLWAQTSGALAPIAALRETSIIFGALIGAVFLGEKLGGRRAIASAVVLVGVGLISVG